MSAHCGYIVRVDKLRPHFNADRLQIATFFGNDTCVDLNAKEGDVGIYFPTDLQLSEEFVFTNHLARKDKEGNPDKGYMDPYKRNVTTIRMRGEKSDGIYLPISCLDYCIGNLKLAQGDAITEINGHEICRKYIPRGQKVNKSNPRVNRTRKKRAPIAPLFVEHADTEQLAYNLKDFKPGDEIEITLKMHGTSQRTGYLLVLSHYKRTFLDKILLRPGKPVYEWGYVTGTRRTVCGDSYEGGFYGDNSFRKQHADFFQGKLHKGEEIFYEVVGFLPNGKPIMGEYSNKKLNDKEFTKLYGDTTVFSYGCDRSKGESDFYVYRMTMTNEDGDIVEYSPDFMRYRCEQIGCKCVPEFKSRIVIPNVDNVEIIQPQIQEVAEFYYDGPDPIGKTHVREGVVVRIVNRPKFTAYKHKNFSFKALEGLVKSVTEVPDMEEAQDLKEENNGEVL